MSASHPSAVDSSRLFEIKYSAVSLPILKLYDSDLRLLAPLLREKIAQAPDFFRNAPMAVDLHELVEAEQALDFTALIRSMRNCGLVPVGLQGGGELHQEAARSVGFPILPDSPRHFQQHQPKPETPPEPETEAVAAVEAVEAVEPLLAEPIVSKIVETPIRSGQKVHSVGDLIVLSQVSAGAEILAEGNIHVYGTLRGRAMAGIQGNPACRIFCYDLQAELIAIAGHYKVAESIEDSVRGVPVQIYLKDKTLIIEKV